MLWLGLGASLVILSLLLVLTFILWKVLAERSSSQTFQQSLISNLQEEKRDLLNRMMSKDLQTYQTMRISPNSYNDQNDEYYPASDAAVVERLRMAAQAQGLGDTLQDDEEVNDFLGDLGMQVNVDLADDSRGHYG